MTCQLCNQRAFHEIPFDYVFKNHRYKLVQCKHCKLITVDPLPPIQVIKEFYNIDYFDKDYRCGIKTKSYYEEDKEQERKALQFLPLLKKIKPSGKLLEIGCAGGTFLYIAREWGYEVQGLEISPYMAKQASQRYGLKIEIGDLENNNLFQGQFDMVCMFDVFEHLPHPLDSLSEVYRLLKPEGVLLIDIPTTKNALAFKLSSKMLRILSKRRDILSPPLSFI